MTAPSDAVTLVEEILELDPASVNPESDLELLGWDSLSDVTFISIADERYHKHVEPTALTSCKTPSDLAGLLA